MRATGRLAIAVIDPELEFTVAIDDQIDVRTGVSGDADLALGGDAVELLEALSIRRPLDQAIDADVAWMVNGLATQFDASPR